LDAPGYQHRVVVHFLFGCFQIAAVFSGEFHAEVSEGVVHHPIGIRHLAFQLCVVNAMHHLQVILHIFPRPFLPFNPTFRLLPDIPIPLGGSSAVIGGIGISKIEAKGEVYGLRHLRDFPGAYVQDAMVSLWAQRLMVTCGSRTRMA
jgi:hypothetical protein